MSSLEKVIRYLWSGHLTPRTLKRWIATWIFEIFLAFIFDVMEAYIIGILAIIFALLSYWYLLDKDRETSRNKPPSVPI